MLNAGCWMLIEILKFGIPFSIQHSAFSLSSSPQLFALS
jgi:hypothetical protein